MNNHYIELAKHCIGLDSKKPYTRHGRKFYRPYRNYFATGAGNDLDAWETMKQAGYAMVWKENRNNGRTYFLSRKGLDWLGEQLGICIYNEED